MTPEQQQAHEEKVRQQRLSHWEATCRELPLADLQDVIEDLQRGIEKARVQSRIHGADPRTDPRGHEQEQRRIWYYEQQRDIARKVLASRFGDR